MSNRLANETSPYLLQHADNPVEWYPWGEQALQRAQAGDKPIFLSGLGLAWTWATSSILQLCPQVNSIR